MVLIYSLMAPADNTAVGLDLAFNDGQPRRQVNLRIHVNGRDFKAVHSAASGGFVFDPPMYVAQIVARVHDIYHITVHGDLEPQLYMWNGNESLLFKRKRKPAKC